jgi:hypothetical protein
MVFEFLIDCEWLDVEQDGFLNDNASNEKLHSQNVWLGTVLDTQGRNHLQECAVLRISEDHNAIPSIRMPPKIAFKRVPGTANCHWVT